MDGEHADFTPAWWLRGRHAQTTWGRLARPRQQVPLRREALIAPDGDTLLVDHLDRPAGGDADDAPRLLLLHGLEGSSNSVYVQGLLALAARAGFRASALNFRYCARDTDDLRRCVPNDRPRLYHSGETSDFDFVARTLAAKAEDLMRRFPEAAERIDLPRARRAYTFRKFDAAATAPLHGFAGADDYYIRSSSLPFLQRITIPTLCVSALDDPFLPPEATRRARDAASSTVRFVVTERGGHAGFVAARGLTPVYWAEEAVIAFLARQAGGENSPWRAAERVGSGL